MKKTGNELYCSLLDVRAGNELADLLTWSAGKARRQPGGRRPPPKPPPSKRRFGVRDGMFHATTGGATKSTFGDRRLRLNRAWLPQPSSFHRQLLQQQLRRPWSSRAKSGKFPIPHYWQDSSKRRERRQNGGYWGVPAGQVDNALTTVNPTLASKRCSITGNFLNTTAPSKSRPGPEWTPAAEWPRRPVLLRKRDVPLAQSKRYMLSRSAGTSVDEGKLERRDGRRLGLPTAGSPFAGTSSVRPTRPLNVNDGAYGNGSGWISSNQSSFVGVAFDRPSPSRRWPLDATTPAQWRTATRAPTSSNTRPLPARTPARRPPIGRLLGAFASMRLPQHDKPLSTRVYVQPRSAA